MADNDAEILAKHGLPSRDELRVEFDSFETDDQGIIYTINKKLLEKSSLYTRFLEDVLQPEAQIVAMQEASTFSDDERKAMYELFRQLTYFERKYLRLQLDGDESAKVAQFKEFFSFFQSTKPQLATFVDKAINVWNGAGPLPEKLTTGYFG